MTAPDLVVVITAVAFVVRAVVEVVLANRAGVDDELDAEKVLGLRCKCGT